MAEQFPVTQTVNVNNKTYSCTVNIPGAESDVTALGKLLAGGRVVKKVVEALSDEKDKDKAYSDTAPVKVIKLFGPRNQYAQIKGYQGKVIHFKAGTTTDDIKVALANCKPFEFTQDKPTRIVVERSEYFDISGSTPSS